MSEPRTITPEEVRPGDVISFDAASETTYHTEGKVHELHGLGREVVGIYGEPSATGDRRALWLSGWAGTITLLDRPAPTIPVGTAGTATVRGVPGVRVMRVGVGYEAWTSVHPVGESDDYLHNDEDVTGFVPDVLWTDELRNDLHAHLVKQLPPRWPSVREYGDALRAFAPGGTS